MVQIVTTKSWGSRLGNAFFGILIGILLIIGSFILIFWNEGHGLHTAKSLEQAEKVVITVPNSPIDSKNNLKVVYFTGEATTEDVLEDSLFNVSQKVIKLHRKVEMYQWKESEETQTQSQLGGSEQETKTYTYKPEWSEELISSDGFKEPNGHQNPASMPIKSRVDYAQKVQVGDFFLPGTLIQQISGENALDLSNVDLSALQKKLTKPVRHEGDRLYAGANPDSPEVGDIRISLSVVPPQTVSVIGQQTRDTVQAYIAPAGQSVLLLDSGEDSPQQMIQNAQSENTMMMWILRGISLFLMIIGISLILKPLVVLADVVPVLGSIIGFGTGAVAFIVGFILWALGTAIAWIFVRPLWALGLIIFIGILVFALYSSRKRQGN